MNVDQYGQIYLKNKMVKFVIDKTVQCETILYSLDSLFNVIVCKTAIVQCQCNYKLNHTKRSYCAFNYASDR